MTRLAPSLALAAVALIGTAATASAHGHAKPDTTHRAVCHPTGKGYVLINPAQASSHIDERTGAPKHEHDGRVDVYAINGACPPLSTPTTIPTTATPSPTSTGSTPSTTTTSVPSTTTSTTAPPTTTATATQTSQPTSPSPTSSTSPTGSQSETVQPSTTPTSAQPSTSATPTGNSTTPSARTTSASSPRRNGPSSTVAPPELAHTGAGLGLAGIGAVLLAAGIALSRKGARRGNH